MTATARASLDEVRRRLEERLAAPGDHFGLDLLQQRLRSALARLKPKKYRDPVEWAEELYLPVLTSPSKPGRLRLTENQKQQLRFIVASILRDITIRKSVQIGFSLTAALAVFYVLEHLEKPAAYVSRSKDEVDKWMKLFFN
ncbi:MAG: hypothetical protein JWO56_2611, partial [Acidobacteria bacterium]|nr:hypothetical protein [Acidobacteriota bacterium]